MRLLQKLQVAESERGTIESDTISMVFQVCFTVMISTLNFVFLKMPHIYKG